MVIYPFNSNYALEKFYCIIDEKIAKKQFFVRVNPDKNYVFRRLKGQISLMRNLGLINNAEKKHYT